MAEKRFIIEVRTKGFARATRDYEKLDRTGNKFKDTQNKMRNNTDGLRGSLGSLRNQILVYTFAIGGAVGAMNKFINASRSFQDVKARLVGLTGSAEEAERVFNQFNVIARDTPFALQDIVNAGAQLEAFGVNSEVTLQAVTDLASYMQVTAVEAANSLGRAFAGGAGAADILRDRGILQLIKDSQGIADLAQTTLPQFRQALFRTLVDPTARIAGSSERMKDTFSGAVTNMQDAMFQFSATMGALVLPKLTEVVKNSEAFFRSLDVKRVAEMGTAILALATAFAALKVQAAFVVGALASFTKIAKALALTATVLGLDKLFQLAGTFDSLKSSTEENTEAVNTQKQAYDNYVASLNEAEIAAKNLMEQQKAARESNNSLTESYQDQVATLEAQIAGAKGASLERQEEIRLMKVLTPEQKIAVQQIEKLRAELEKLEETQRKANEARKNAITLEQNTQVFMEDIRQETFKRAAEELAAMKQEEAQRIKQVDTTIKKTDDMTDATSQATGAINALASAMHTLGNESATTEQKNAAMLRTIGSLVSLIPGGQIAGTFISAGAAFVAHTGGLIRDNGIQRFANGGVVQGQDNVPILAQAGEFVMQRSAVQNIGVENLARMNNGESAGVTVNVSAPLVDDHILDTIIPAINNAVANNKATLS